MRTLTVAILTAGLAACSASRTPSQAPAQPAGTSTVAPEQAMKAPTPVKQPKLKIQVAYLGIDSAPIADGLRITEVGRNSPAARAGLRPRDIILAANDLKISKAAELRQIVRAAGPGQPVVLRVRRDGGANDVTVVTGCRMQCADDDDDDEDYDDEDDDDDEDEDEDDDDDDEDEDDEEDDD